MTVTTLANIATLAEAEEICSTPQSTLRHAIYRGDLPARKIRSIWIVDLDDVQEYTKRPARPRQHTVIELHNEGHGSRSIAEILGIKYRSVKRALNRAGIIENASRNPYTVEDDREFIDRWNNADSPAAVGAHYNRDNAWASYRASALRGKGYHLKRMKRGPRGGNNPRCQREALEPKAGNEGE